MTSKRRFAFIANSNKVDISSLKTIEKYFLDTLDDAVFYITNNENELDSIASLGADVYVALGGDGTLNSLLNALRTPSSPFKRDSLPIVGVLPFGNGDDFAQSVGFSPKHFSSKKISKQQNLQKIFEPFIQTQYNDTFVAPVYYGDFWINNDPVPKQFFSYVGLGLFAQAVKQANKKSNKSYFKELKKVYNHAQLESFVLRQDSKQTQRNLITFECMNNLQFGGGLEYNPQGSYFSSSFQTIGLEKLSLLQIIKNYHHIKMKKGRHLEHEKVTYNSDVKDMLIDVARPLPLHYDGETISDVCHVHIRSGGYPIRVITKNI